MHESVRKAKRSLKLGELKLQEKDPGYSILADPMFEKAVHNIIENTLRHSGGAKCMEITASEHQGMLKLVFEDDGQGIYPEDKAHLFERGYGKNTGFGLFLTYEILDITGITITENSEVGKGARFEITVPAGGWRSA